MRTLPQTPGKSLQELVGWGEGRSRIPSLGGNPLVLSEIKTITPG